MAVLHDHGYIKVQGKILDHNAMTSNWGAFGWSCIDWFVDFRRQVFRMVSLGCMCIRHGWKAQVLKIKQIGFSSFHRLRDLVLHHKYPSIRINAKSDDGDLFLVILSPFITIYEIIIKWRFMIRALVIFVHMFSWSYFSA